MAKITRILTAEKPCRTTRKKSAKAKSYDVRCRNLASAASGVFALAAFASCGMGYTAFQTLRSSGWKTSKRAMYGRLYRKVRYCASDMSWNQVSACVPNSALQDTQAAYDLAPRNPAIYKIVLELGVSRIRRYPVSATFCPLPASHPRLAREKTYVVTHHRQPRTCTAPRPRTPGNTDRTRGCSISAARPVCRGPWHRPPSCPAKPGMAPTMAW